MASSRRRILGSRMMALAMAMRCFWPRDSWEPWEPTLVLYFWRRRTNGQLYCSSRSEEQTAFSSDVGPSFHDITALTFVLSVTEQVLMLPWTKNSFLPNQHSEFHHLRPQLHLAQICPQQLRTGGLLRKLVGPNFCCQFPEHLLQLAGVHDLLTV